jgi:hypothetical protein
MVAFFFAEEDQPKTGPVQAASPQRQVSAVEEAKKEFGRPRPNVVVSQSPAEPWRETWPEEPAGSAEPVPAPVAPIEPEPAYDPATFDEVLVELDAIEREVNRLRRRSKAEPR